MTTPIKFTPTKPTEAGAYWVRPINAAPGDCELVHVVDSIAGLIVRNQWHGMFDTPLEWSGPLYPREG